MYIYFDVSKNLKVAYEICTIQLLFKKRERGLKENKFQNRTSQNKVIRIPQMAKILILFPDWWRSLN